MDLRTFKKFHKRFSNFPLSRQEWETPQYAEYIAAINEDNDCHSWYLKQQIKKAGINYKRFCCLSMAYHLINDKSEDKKDNADRIMTYIKSQKAFGIPIHDGGASFIAIAYCPWCGEDLSNYPIIYTKKK